jgi:hypothetical protein
MDLRVDAIPTDGGWTVHVALVLDRHETSELFMLGDRLVSWPTEGLAVFGFGPGAEAHTAHSPMVRGGMFLSEIVAHPEGIRLTYREEHAARRAARVLEYQVREVFTEP